MEKPEKVELVYEYKKRRKEFGRQTLFEDHGPEMIVSIPNNPAQYPDYILRNPVHCAIQNTGTMSEHWVNSVRAEYTSSGVSHVEGGWPKDINMNDPEATQRYRRKIEKDDAYIHAVMHLGHSMEHNILQNNAVDMYETYNTELPAIPPVENSGCHTVNVYREPDGRRPIRSLSWQADGGAKLAVAHADIELTRNSRNPQYSYIWDIENANAPELVIKPPQPLLDLIYNPRDPHLIIGGMMNGQVGWWDTRKGGDPAGVCPPHVAHRDIARNVLFINSKIGAEFFSSSPDGVVKWQYEAHFGPVYALQRNPTFVKNFLTVGDWTARVWSEDCRESAILWTYSHRTKLTDGAWNPIRFSLMLVTQWDGCLSCWDLLRRRSAPLVTAQLCDEPLLRLRPHEGGLLVACGSSKGTVYLAELSENLGTADKNDKQLLTHVLDRENKRERILEARMRELRLKMRQGGNANEPAVETDPSMNDRDLEEATAEYMQTINDLQAQQKTEGT
ncbi:hypothetical protein SFRURICE_012232 [Spodoptera frugiperda]|nr:hypothetical protein SFRURICE_012232 [Spodoptera frugiperda]